MQVDKSKLLSSRTVHYRDVEVPGMGSIRVRALKRGEVMAMQGVQPLDLEVKMLAAACVEPELTEEEARQWQAEATPMELDPVILAIMELSGMAPDADRAAMSTFRDAS